MDLVIFDLDGTLVDSKLDLAHAVNATRQHMGMAPLPDEQVASYVGNGAPVLIRKAIGPEATEQEIQEALEFFLDYYGDHKLDCTVAYPGVREALEKLHSAGVTMAVLTNKPVRISREIIKGLNLAGYFRQVYGGNSFDHKKPHPVGVETLMEECGADRGGTAVVGDSSVDIKTARNAGVTAIGVTYGLQPESLADPAPDVLMDRMEDVADWILARKDGEKQ